MDLSSLLNLLILSTVQDEKLINKINIFIQWIPNQQKYVGPMLFLTESFVIITMFTL